MLRALWGPFISYSGTVGGSSEAGGARQGIFLSIIGAVDINTSWPSSGHTTSRYHVTFSPTGATTRMYDSDSIPGLGSAAYAWYGGLVQMANLPANSDTADQVVATFYNNQDDGGIYYGLACSKTGAGTANFSYSMCRINNNTPTLVGATRGGIGGGDSSSFRPYWWVEVCIRLSDKYVRWWVDGTEVTSGFTDLTGGLTVICDGKLELKSVKFAGKASSPYKVNHANWVVSDDVQTGNVYHGNDGTEPLGTAYKELMLHQVECDVTGKDDATPSPDPGSGLHWSNIDDHNDADFPDGAGPEPTDLLTFPNNVAGSQMAGVASQDGASATVVGVCLFIGFDSPAGEASNNFVTDFKFLAFLSGGPLSEYVVLGYSADEDYVWWVNLPEKPGGGSWTLTYFNNLRVGINRETARDRNYQIRAINIGVLGTNLVQPTKTVASPVACTVDGPVAAAAAFVPRVMVY